MVYAALAKLSPENVLNGTAVVAEIPQAVAAVAAAVPVAALVSNTM